MRRRVWKLLVAIPIAAVLVASNIAGIRSYYPGHVADAPGGQYRGYYGGFATFTPYLIPVETSFPPLQMWLVDQSGNVVGSFSVEDQPAIRIAVETPRQVGLYSHDGMAMLNRVVRIHIVLESEEGHSWESTGNLGDHWKPRSDSFPGQTVVDQDLVWNVPVRKLFELLPPGRYVAYATIYAEPPYGAGVDALEMNPPQAHVSTTPYRMWLVTQHLLPIDLEIQAAANASEVD